MENIKSHKVDGKLIIYNKRTFVVEIDLDAYEHKSDEEDLDFFMVNEITAESWDYLCGIQAESHEEAFKIFIDRAL